PVAMSAAALAGTGYFAQALGRPEDAEVARGILQTIVVNIDSPYYVADFGNNAALSLVYRRAIMPEGSAEALKLSTRMIEAAEREDPASLPIYLDNHAMALFYSGHREEGLAAQRRAIDRCPPGDEATLKALRSNLELLEAGGE